MYNKFMAKAIEAAKIAFHENEIPIGAVIEKNGEILSIAHNASENQQCAICHAEVIAIKEACRKIGEKYLIDCNLYTTLEPCYMCAGAIVLAKIKSVYIGAKDEKYGAVLSGLRVFENANINHLPVVYDCIMDDGCSKLLTDFFTQKRLNK